MQWTGHVRREKEGSTTKEVWIGKTPGQATDTMVRPGQERDAVGRLRVRGEMRRKGPVIGRGGGSTLVRSSTSWGVSGPGSK